MNTLAFDNAPARRSDGRAVLTAAARFWFAIAVLGQLIFAFYIGSFYGGFALRGDVQGWNNILPHGYVAGATLGNAALSTHLLFAMIITLGGPIQLVPMVRSRYPRVHRWIGRSYVLIAVMMAASGLYLSLSGRRVVGDWTQHVAVEINAILILVCAAMALRHALRREFAVHRRWALRLFLVVNGVWFFRVGLMLSFLLFRGPYGFDLATFTGPTLTILTFGQFLIPLGLLELYLRAQDHAGGRRRAAVAATLLISTVLMGAGIAMAVFGMWSPAIATAFDRRTPIGDTMFTTLSTKGIDAAETQYRLLKSAPVGLYNFDEDQLNSLGYQLVRRERFADAIRIFRINADSYPRSSNAWDSLAEAYRDQGDKALAIGSYQKALDLDAHNLDAAKNLARLQGS